MASAWGRFGDRGELEWRMGEIRLSWGRWEIHGEVQISMEKFKTGWRISKRHGEVENSMEKFKTAWGNRERHGEVQNGMGEVAWIMWEVKFGADRIRLLTGGGEMARGEVWEARAAGCLGRGQDTSLGNFSGAC